MNPLFARRERGNQVINMTPEQIEMLRLLVASHQPNEAIAALSDQQGEATPPPGLWQRLLRGLRPEGPSIQNIGIRG